MGTFLKIFSVVGLLAGLLVVGLMFLGGGTSGRLDGAAYRPSDEPLYPSEISKNPYKYEGHSGILNTLDVPLGASMGGRKIMTPYPGGNLVFQNMLDEHTAVFNVRTGGELGVESTDQIAVKLDDSNPPEPMRPWRLHKPQRRAI